MPWNIPAEKDRTLRHMCSAQLCALAPETMSIISVVMLA